MIKSVKLKQLSEDVTVLLKIKKMDSIVEENGNSTNVGESGHNLSTSSTIATTTPTGVGASVGVQQNNTTNLNIAPPLLLPPPPPPPPAQLSAAPTAVAASVLSTTPNLQYHIPTAVHGLQMQSVIQAANQSSVIQTAATNAQPLIMQKGSGVLFVAKQNPATVIQTTSSNAVQIKPEPSTQSLDTNSEDSLSDDESPRRRQDLTRRPSYHKILTEISGPDISAGPTLHMAESGGIPTIATGGSTSATLIHLPQDSAPAFYIPNRIPFNTNNSVIAEDQTRKREIRLQKNREAARECRRKKKEYIKCLENRVAVLENQNKALIEELKSLKELYCQTKND